MITRLLDRKLSTIAKVSVTATAVFAITGAAQALAQPEPQPVIGTIGDPARHDATESKPNSHLSLNGPVGLTLNPTAELPASHEVRVQLDSFHFGKLDNDSEGFFAGIAGFTPTDDELGEFEMTSLHIATRLAKSRLEINGGVEKMRAGRGQAGTGFFFIFPLEVRVDHDDMNKTRPAIGLKYLVLGDEAEPSSLRVAVGGGYNPALFGNTHAYVVASKPIKIGGRFVKVHMGGRYDRFTFESHLVNTFFGEQNFEDRSRKFSVFSGIEVPFDRKGRFSFVGEIGTKNSDFNGGATPVGSFDVGQTTSRFPYSAAFRIATSQGLAASIGVMRQGVIDDSGWFADVGYGF